MLLSDLLSLSVKFDTMEKGKQSITPGERLLQVRGLLRISRSYIQEKYGLSPDTLRSWEGNKVRLTDKAVKRCLKIYRNEGVVISDNWLLTGEGLDPKLGLNLGRYYREIQLPDKGAELYTEDVRIAREANYFKKINSEAITMQVSNEDMLPFYAPGDSIGGRIKRGKSIEECIGKDCIIKTQEGALFFRRVSKHNALGGYNLACLNPSWGGTPEPVLYNILVDYAAPIVWHRRFESQ